MDSTKIELPYVYHSITHVLSCFFFFFLFRLHRMHEMQTIVTDVRSVCLSVTRLNWAARAICAGSFGTIFAKLLWLLVGMPLAGASCAHDASPNSQPFTVRSLSLCNMDTEVHRFDVRSYRSSLLIQSTCIRYEMMI